MSDDTRQSTPDPRVPVGAWSGANQAPASTCSVRPRRPVLGMLRLTPPTVREG
jgi:hypothetical protein